MTNHDKQEKLITSDNKNLRQARITTKTAEEMLNLLKGRSFELVGRGPHQMPDGSYVAEVIGDKVELKKVSKLECEIEIKNLQRIKESEKQISTTNRYTLKNAIPRGVGIKK